MTIESFKNWNEATVAIHNARVARGKAGVPEAPQEGVQPSREARLHDEIEAELKRRGWYYVHSRLDRATTQAKGVPDFIIAAPGNGKSFFQPRTFWIEVKTAKGKLTTEQAGTLHWLGQMNHVAKEVRSLGEFLKVIE